MFFGNHFLITKKKRMLHKKILMDSELGALQLLTDFAFVSTWVTECSIISQNVRDYLLKNEVLRRCEGVGRLLLRHPGEAIAMHKRLRKFPPSSTKKKYDHPYCK